MKGYDINKIVESVLSYSERHNRKVTIAYLLIPGLMIKQLMYVNQEDGFVRKCFDKSLQYNDTANCNINRPNKQQLVAFKLRLEAAGLEVK